MFMRKPVVPQQVGLPPPTVSVDPPAPAESAGFSWESYVLESEGTARPDQQANTPAIPQRFLAAKQRAVTAARLQLREKVRQLKVSEEATVGDAMETVISVQRSIDQAIQRAPVVREEKLEGGGVRVQLRMELGPIAEVLRQNYVAPNEALPEAPNPEEMGFGPVV